MLFKHFPLINFLFVKNNISIDIEDVSMRLPYRGERSWGKM